VSDSEFPYLVRLRKGEEPVARFRTEDDAEEYVLLCRQMEADMDNVNLHPRLQPTKACDCLPDAVVWREAAS
jgi:hypothetical protein